MNTYIYMYELSSVCFLRVAPTLAPFFIICYPWNHYIAQGYSQNKIELVATRPKLYFNYCSKCRKNLRKSSKADSGWH